jgi:hypothetical protein
VGGSIRVHRCINDRENAGYVFQNVVVPEPQHTITIRFEISCTRLVRRTAGMLTAIDLDDNSYLMTGEVGEVRTNRRLTPKVALLERRLPQMLPEFLLGFGRVTT